MVIGIIEVVFEYEGVIDMRRCMIVVIFVVVFFCVGVLFVVLVIVVVLMGGGYGGGYGFGQCFFVDKMFMVMVSVDQSLIDVFMIYGDIGGVWIGGDSMYFLLLGKGKMGWFFLDIFFGMVNFDGLCFIDFFFVNNLVVVQDCCGILIIIIGGIFDDLVGIILFEFDGKWYWIGDLIFGCDGIVQVLLLQFVCIGIGQWDFVWMVNWFVMFDGGILQLEFIVDLFFVMGINWGFWMFEECGIMYIYGIVDFGGVWLVYVVCVQDWNGFKGMWMYWNGMGWLVVEMDVVFVVFYVVNEFSVVLFCDGYLLVMQDMFELFSICIVVCILCLLIGLFIDLVELYCMFEIGVFGSYGDFDVFMYNVYEYFNLCQGNCILVFYNVNMFDNVGDVYDDVLIYCLWFIDVQFKVIG